MCLCLCKSFCGLGFRLYKGVTVCECLCVFEFVCLFVSLPVGVSLTVFQCVFVCVSGYVYKPGNPVIFRYNCFDFHVFLTPGTYPIACIIINFINTPNRGNKVELKLG